MIDFETLIKTVESLSGPLSEIQKDRFLRMEGLYREWNSKINVISRKDMDEFYSHHVFHSLCIAFYMKGKGGFPDGASILDLGTGGGFPGIPLAMTTPGAQFTLCDSIGKKVKVAQALADGLGLTNVVCINARAESLPETYDWVVSRAVTSLDNFYPWVKGKFAGGILYLKGGDVNLEISELCRKSRLDPAKITVWPVSEWLSDDYFKEKFVIHIRK